MGVAAWGVGGAVFARGRGAGRWPRVRANPAPPRQAVRSRGGGGAKLGFELPGERPRQVERSAASLLGDAARLVAYSRALATEEGKAFVALLEELERGAGGIAGQARILRAYAAWRRLTAARGAPWAELLLRRVLRGDSGNPFVAAAERRASGTPDGPERGLASNDLAALQRLAVQEETVVRWVRELCDGDVVHGEDDPSDPSPTTESPLPPDAQRALEAAWNWGDDACLDALASHYRACGSGAFQSRVLAWNPATGVCQAIDHGGGASSEDEAEAEPLSALDWSHPGAWAWLASALDAFAEGGAPGLGLLVAGETETSGAGRVAASAAATALGRQPRLRVVRVPLAGGKGGDQLKLEELGAHVARHPNLSVLALLDGVDVRTLAALGAHMGGAGAAFGRPWPANLGVLCSSSTAAPTLLRSPGAEALEAVVLGVLSEPDFQAAADRLVRQARAPGEVDGGAGDETELARGDGTAAWWLQRGAAAAPAGEKITLGFATGVAQDATPPAAAWARARGLPLDLGAAQAYATHLKRYSPRRRIPPDAP